MQRDQKPEHIINEEYVSPTILRLAAQILHHGGVIAYPTEAVYGLGCDPLNEQAIQKILDLKQRPLEKGMILIAANYQQIENYIDIDDSIKNRIIQTWPGSYTWIIPARAWVPKILTGNRNTLAVRVTNHPVAAQICRFFGSPIVSTSANPSGFRPPRTLIQLRKYFTGKKLFVVPGATGKLNRPTTIQNAITGEEIRK